MKAPRKGHLHEEKGLWEADDQCWCLSVFHTCTSSCPVLENARCWACADPRVCVFMVAAGQWPEVADFILDVENLLSSRIQPVIWRLGVDSPLTHEKEACGELILSLCCNQEKESCKKLEIQPGACLERELLLIRSAALSFFRTPRGADCESRCGSEAGRERFLTGANHILNRTSMHKKKTLIVW